MAKEHECLEKTKGMKKYWPALGHIRSRLNLPPRLRCGPRALLLDVPPGKSNGSHLPSPGCPHTPDGTCMICVEAPGQVPLQSTPILGAEPRHKCGPHPRLQMVKDLWLAGAQGWREAEVDSDTPVHDPAHPSPLVNTHRKYTKPDP